MVQFRRSPRRSRTASNIFTVGCDAGTADSVKETGREYAPEINREEFESKVLRRIWRRFQRVPKDLQTGSPLVESMTMYGYSEIIPYWLLL